MSVLQHRLAYDDADSPQQMYGDCRAVGANLHLSGRPAPAHPRVGLDRYRAQPPTVFVIHDEVAVMAGSLHLHFD